MESEEVMKIVKTPVAAPKCNAFAERHVREIRETLDNMILFGEGHLHHVVKQIETHHNRFRPHQGLANSVPLDFPYPDEPVMPEKVRRDSLLGGLLNHYYAEDAA